MLLLGDCQSLKAFMLYARRFCLQGLIAWLLIFRPICKRESWAQHASTQPPDSGLKFVAQSYNVGSVLLLVG
jgi:hypothetical protein